MASSKDKKSQDREATKQPDRRSLGAGTIAVAVVVGVALAAAGYGVGHLTMAMEVDEVEQQLAQTREQATEEQETLERRMEKQLESTRQKAAAKRSRLEERLEAANARATKLEGRRELGRVLLSLDDRNFGIAQRHLDAAMSHLDKVASDEGELRELVGEMREEEVVVAGNLAQQRQRFRAIIDRFDSHVDGDRANEL